MHLPGETLDTLDTLQRLPEIKRPDTFTIEQDSPSHTFDRQGTLKLSPSGIDTYGTKAHGADTTYEGNAP